MIPVKRHSEHSEESARRVLSFRAQRGICSRRGTSRSLTSFGRFLVANAPRNDSNARGFSLLEVLVAFVIVALVGTALFRLFGGALNNASAADDYSRAVLLAESRLASTAVESAPLREGSSDQGRTEDGKYSWITRVEPYVGPGTTPDQDRLGQAANIRLWRIAVTVSWPGAIGQDRSLTLATVRLASKQP